MEMKLAENIRAFRKRQGLTHTLEESLDRKSVV